MELKNISASILSLETCKEEISDYLKNEPTLFLRATSVLDRLIDGFKHQLGVSVESKKEEFRLQPLTSIMGNKILSTPELKVKKPNTDEIKIIRDKANELYKTFLDRDNSELLESLNDIEIRSVAKIVGVRWSKKDIEIINSDYIEEIKNGIKSQKELKQKQQAEKLRVKRSNEKGLIPKKNDSIPDKID